MELKEAIERASDWLCVTPMDKESKTLILDAARSTLTRTAWRETFAEREAMIADRDRTIEQLRAELAEEKALVGRQEAIIRGQQKRVEELDRMYDEVCNEATEKGKCIKTLESFLEDSKRAFMRQAELLAKAEKRSAPAQDFHALRNKMIADTMSAMVRNGGELGEELTLFIADLMVWEPKP